MIQGIDRDKFHDGLFEKNKDSPQAWAFMAWDLRAGGEVLFEAYRNSWHPETREPLTPENERLNTPATMLYGWAMENLVKGYLIKKHGGFEQARNANQIAWDRYQISRLALDTGLPLTADQKLVLGTLEAFIVWAGRYPISMKRDKFTIPRQLHSENHMPPNHIQCTEIELLEPFYKKLNDEIFENFRKKNADLASL